MVKNDNPAGRLYSILDELRKYNSTNLWDALYKTLASESELDFYAKLLQLKKLVVEVRNIVENSEEMSNKALYLSYYSQIENIMKIKNLDVPMQHQIIPQLSDAVLLNLAYISENLPYRFREILLEAEQLNNFIKEIEELIDEIKKSNLIAELRNLILEQLNILLTSINQYKIRGADGLRSDVNSGHQTLHAAIWPA